MKKALLLLALALTWAGASAQEADSVVVDETRQTIDSLKQAINTLNEKNTQIEEDLMMEKIWKRRKWFTVGFGKTTLEIEDPDFMADYGQPLKYSSQFSVSLSSGRTYWLHKRPIAKMVKFGIDASFFNLNYALYKKGKGLDLNIPDYDDYDDFDDYYNDYEDYDDFADINLGMHQLTYSLGVGPSVTVTPFYPLGIKALNYVKVGAYFHWLPSYSLVIRTKDSEPVYDKFGDLIGESESQTLLNHGYCNFFRFGLNIQWKALTIGFEHRWGSAKFNTESFDDEYEEFNPSTGDYETVKYDSPKMKHTTKSNRFFIGFRF